MKTTLIGSTGFVGSNLILSHNFDFRYNSKNISEAFDHDNELVIYAGVRAEKYLANNNPDQDMLLIHNAIENIKKLNPKKLLLISTIDVYKNPNAVDENSVIDESGLHVYGFNRHYLEKWVKDNMTDYHIIRLPALFGANLKKNFIYDMITIIPFMLKIDKFDEIKKNFPTLETYYDKIDNFYRLKASANDSKELKTFFTNNDFNAIKFTDSRNSYPFYNLKNLWKDINIAIKNNIRLLNIATEPILASDIYERVYNKKFVNEISQNHITSYDMKSIYYDLFGGSNGYLYNKESTLKEIKEFIKSKDIK